MTNDIEPRATSATELEHWLVTRIAQLMDIGRDQIDAEQPFSAFGLDSVAAVGLVGELEEYLEIEIPPTVMWDFPTIAQLVRHLCA